MNENLKNLAIKAARILEDKKGEQVALYDLGGKSSLCDYVIVATATSAPHLNALEDEVSIKLKEDGFFKLNRDGSGSQVWRVSDYGGLMLHVMTAEARAYYALDKMFEFAELIPTIEKAIKKAAKKTAKKAVKKTAKKSVKKSVKTVKKTTKKTVKKTAKKAVKKTVKKAVKKPAKKAAKAIKKTTKKTTKKGAK